MMPFVMPLAKPSPEVVWEDTSGEGGRIVVWMDPVLSILSLHWLKIGTN